MNERQRRLCELKRVSVCLCAISHIFFIIISIAIRRRWNVPNNINNNDVILYVPKFGIMSRSFIPRLSMHGGTPRAHDISYRENRAPPQVI